jgi:hypothetical protein
MQILVQCKAILSETNPPSVSHRNEYQRQIKMFLEIRAGPVREVDNPAAICELIV